MTRRLVRLSLIIILVGILVGAAAPAWAAFPGRDGAIAFSRFTDRQTDIWLIRPGAARARRVTATPRKREGLADWNAAGNRIAYTRCARGGPLSNCDLWSIRPNGSDATRLTATPSAQETWPSWSPDGTKIAYTSNAEDVFQDIWVMDADGGNQTKLTGVEGFDAFPEWSPDGTKIAFTSDRKALDDIWVMDADGGNPTRLTRGPKIDERPDWSPDGSRIVFTRNGDIWMIDADGSDPRRLTSTRRHEFGAIFSPSGRRIAFNLEVNGRIGVWRMRLDGSGRRQVTFGKLDMFPDWQPR